MLCINLENFYTRGSSLKEIPYDYFFKFKKSLIYLEEEYKFRIDVFNFLFYGKYIEYIRKSIYNEYLTFIPVLFNYPLLKTLFRLIVYTRLSKIQDHDYRSSSNVAILRKYHIYDDFEDLKVFKTQKIFSNYSNSSLLVNNFLNTNLMKFLII